VICISNIDSKQGYANKLDKNVLIIPQNPVYTNERTSLRKQRVCAYARVSTPDEAQTSSYDLQCEYYEEFIKKNENWIYVGVYADQGISGTNRKKRDNFNRMIDDCKSGKIDLIVTKSVSRFSRNVLDCLSVVRELAELEPKVGVFFQTENINTLTRDSEIYLTILSAFSQEESRAKSESMLWSIEKRFSKGQFLCPTSSLLGYTKVDKKLAIEPEGAKTVRLIYSLFLAGYSANYIADTLTELGRPTGRGKTKWSSVSVRNILKNERYCGDIVAQKTFTKSYITHDHEVNKGQKQVYYSADHHESIISRDDYIQSLLLLSSNRNSNRLDVGYTLTVIKEGMLKGFVPINRAHGGYKVPHFVMASKSAYDNDAENNIAGIVFNLPGYEVARIQEFANGDKAKMTLSNKWLRFNTSCIRKMPNVEYVEILMHPIDRLIAVRPCSENNPNAILWKKVYKNRLQSTHVSSATFANLLYELMGWKDEWQIEIVANCKNRDQDSILLFDLKEPIFKVKKTKRITDESDSANEESESYTAKLLPGEWRDNFGKQMVEHAYSNMNHDEHNDREWNISAEGIAVEGFEVKTKIKSEEDIKRQIEEMQN
jgi:DNA invertase Pin-like site-specific DNA recombinase